MSAAIVFPVRYVSAGLAIQTTSRELSEGGLAIRSLSPPPAGARLSMALYLPGSRIPEVAIGRVTRSLGNGAFWAEFVVIDASARMRIVDLVSDLKAEVAGKRTFDRIPVELRVRFRTAREFAIEHATNLSRGGIFIRCEEPPPKDEPVEVHIELPDGEVVITRGVVVHSSGVAPKGVGVQFVDATDRFRERLDKYMESLRGGASSATP